MSKEIDIYSASYIVVPKFIFVDSRLNAIDIKVSALLYSSSENDFVIQNNKLAKLFNVSESTIIRSLRNLEELGYIKCNNINNTRVIHKCFELGVSKLDTPLVKSDNPLVKSDNPSKEKEKEKKKSNIKENKEKEREILFTPLSPQKTEGGCGYVDNSVDNNKININEQKQGLESVSGVSGRKVAYSNQKSNGGAFSGEYDKLNKQEAVGVVNWENCRSDIQRFVAFWVKLNEPNLYNNATKEQVYAIYGQYARYAKSILGIAGDLEKAKEASKMCREWLLRNKLSYNLATIARNIGRFLNRINKNADVPIEVDLALWNEYCELREMKKGKFDKNKALEFIKDIISQGKNPNELLERRIVELKRDNSDVIDFIKTIPIKTIQEEK